MLRLLVISCVILGSGSLGVILALASNAVSQQPNTAGSVGMPAIQGNFQLASLDNASLQYTSLQTSSPEAQSTRAALSVPPIDERSVKATTQVLEPAAIQVPQIEIPPADEMPVLDSEAVKPLALAAPFLLPGALEPEASSIAAPAVTPQLAITTAPVSPETLTALSAIAEPKPVQIAAAALSDGQSLTTINDLERLIDQEGGLEQYIQIPLNPSYVPKPEPVAEEPVQVARALVQTSKFASGRHLTSVMPGKKTTATYGPHHVNNRRYCALTFDDGPNPIIDAKILQVLRNEGVKATFFVLGRGVRSNKKLIRQMVAEGHEVANHSWSHPQLTKRSLSSVKSQLRDTNKALAELGIYPKVFRPPYGAQGPKIRKVARDMGMETMLWDVDSLDWKLKTGDRIRRKIDQQSSYSSVVLLHSNTRSVPGVLPAIIRDLRAKGCRFVTSSEWIAGLSGSAAGSAKSASSQSSNASRSQSSSALTSPRIVEKSTPRAARSSNSQEAQPQSSFVVY